jgi:ABC-type amino acid transport substrate-binding protein
MTDRRSPAERIASWLEQDAPTDVPNRVLEAAFERTRSLPQQRAAWPDQVRRPRTILLVAAALIVALSLLGIAIAGGRLLPGPAPDSLALLRSVGVMRIAVDPGAPQALEPGGRPDAFGPDVAALLGARMGLQVTVLPIAADELIGRSRDWDVALPWIPSWELDRTLLRPTPPLYGWPRLVLVRADSGASSLGDVAGQPMCAVAHDAGQDWLLGDFGPPDASPTLAPKLPSALIVRNDDAGCLQALDEGTVVAMVSARLSPADVGALPRLRVVAALPVETRAAVVRAGDPDPTSLVAELSRVVRDLHDDGTLARLTRDRFGADLTVTP